MKKVVNYKANGEEWEEAKTKAFNKIVKKVKVDGFRNGKVPRSVFEKKYGTSDIIREAMEDIINVKYNETIISEKLFPVIEPKLEVVSLNDDGFECNVIFTLEPEAKLGKYKELKVKKDKVTVKKEEVEHQIGHILDRYAELVSKDGKVENGDTVIIDFKGFKDNVPFEGGSAENYSLEIGSNSFIPGFEDAIIGMKKEESKDIPLTFPKDYLVEDLKEKDVIFNVLVHDIKRRVIPELDEEFFKDLNMDDVTNKDELYKKVEEEIRKYKEDDAENKFEENLLEKISSNMTVEMDEDIIDYETNLEYENFISKLKTQGVDEELYFAYTRTNKEDMLKEMRENITKKLKYRYLLAAVIKEEKIKVTDKDVEEKIEKIIEKYGITKEDIIKEYGSIDNYKFQVLFEKAIDFLKENN